MFKIGFFDLELGPAADKRKATLHLPYILVVNNLLAF